MGFMLTKKGAEKSSSASTKKQSIILTYEGEVRGMKTTIRRYASDPFPPPSTLEVRSQTEYINTELDKGVQ